MNRAVREPQSLNRAFGAIQNAVVYFVREARGGHVEGLFKIRPFERVRFVENPENSELSTREQSLDGHFRAGNIALHQQLVEFRFARDLYFRGFQQILDPRNGGLKFFRLIRANHSLARGEAQRLDDARKLDARENFFHALVEPERKKSGHRESRIAQDLALAQFAAAIFHGLRGIVGESQRARGVRRRRRRPVAESDQSIHGPHERLFYDEPRRLFRIVEADRDRAVRPRVFELVAAVARKHDIHAQRFRGFREAARLVTQFTRENQ